MKIGERECECVREREREGEREREKEDTRTFQRQCFTLEPEAPFPLRDARQGLLAFDVAIVDRPLLIIGVAFGRRFRMFLLPVVSAFVSIHLSIPCVHPCAGSMASKKEKKNRKEEKRNRCYYYRSFDRIRDPGTRLV